MPLQARVRKALKRTETKFDAALGRVDAIEAEACPNERDDHQRARQEAAVRPLLAGAPPEAAAAAKQSAQLALQIAYHGIEIRRTFVLVGSPWIAFIAVVPSHCASHFLSNTVG